MDNERKLEQYQLAETLLSEQNFFAAIVGGGIAMLLAAAAYGLIVHAWPIMYGFACAGVGCVVGFFTGLLGRGISKKFAVLAVAYTIVGCILGNLLFNFLASRPVDPGQGGLFFKLADWAVSGFSVLHLVYCFVAVFAAVFLAMRPLSREQRLAIGMLEMRA